jgi:2-polyprenyl-6-methoxyphenol hydroxylase-like FAD-dependent oxidoreductase
MLCGSRLPIVPQEGGLEIDRPGCGAGRSSGERIGDEEIFNVIKNAEPLSAPTPYHFSSNLRRRYERLSHSPEGFLVFGDALCSFNPIFGQGMTVACMESLALQNCLENGQQGQAKRFFRATSRLVDVPWQIAVGSDLQNSKVEGKRTMQVRFI